MTASVSPTLSIAGITLLSAFGILSIVHLVFCFLEMEGPRKWTKPFCVLLLAIAVLLDSPNLYFVWIGLLFGTLGDVLLIYKHKVWMLVGGTLAFMVNHAFFILQYLTMLGWSLPWYHFAIVAFLVFVIMIAGIALVHKAIKTPSLGFGALCYFSIIFVDFYFAVACSSLGFFDFILLNVLGMILFIGSDVYLTKTLFFRDNKRRDFYIMATYLAAQLLVSLGFLLTL